MHEILARKLRHSLRHSLRATNPSDDGMSGMYIWSAAFLVSAFAAAGTVYVIRRRKKNAVPTLPPAAHS